MTPPDPAVARAAQRAGEKLPSRPPCQPTTLYRPIFNASNGTPGKTPSHSVPTIAITSTARTPYCTTAGENASAPYEAVSATECRTAASRADFFNIVPMTRRYT